MGYGASKPLRDAEAWQDEGMKSAYSGTGVFNGRVYRVTTEKSYGYTDKNWGRDFTSPWVWLSSHCLTSRRSGQRLTNSVFDIGGGWPKIYFVPLDRRLLGVFCYEGEEYDFNFSKLHLKAKTDFSPLKNKTSWWSGMCGKRTIMLPWRQRCSAGSRTCCSSTMRRLTAASVEIAFGTAATAGARSNSRRAACPDG